MTMENGKSYKISRIRSISLSLEGGGEIIVHIPSISWIITNKCNLSCAHCYPDSGKGKEIELSYSEKEIVALFTSIDTVSPKVVYISGGEPLLKTHLLDYIKGARKAGSEIVWICSNGTLISDKFLKTARHYGVNGFTISFQHTDPREMDALSGGKGVYDKVMNGLTKIKKAGFNLTLEMTVLKNNYCIIEDIIQAGIKARAEVIVFKRFRPVGRGKINKYLALSPEENQQVLHYLFQHSLRQNKVKFFVQDPLFSIEAYKYFKEKVKGQILKYSCAYVRCGAGVKWVGIDPLGNVSPCPLLRYTGLVIGNIHENPLDKIIENSKEVRSLRNAHTHSDSCRYSMICGGCRTHAAAVTGDYTQKDPMCVYDEYTCPIQNVDKDRY